ncbi:M23 family metallopeptidase [Paenibacillus soyae]|uniref:M23 family metallopeptidase n=1 Tax=Paenibacillus soyae TaxID=2969249 RepID=A0A9X2MTM0_9BACL|nr:M23 family metallopeptidase [Paenibacillus soyae]MCR2806771.1 M23 family metallopeptidase [Paenibacillus soyae]
MAAAAIIVTLMWIYQGSDPAKETTGQIDSEVTQEDGSEEVQGGTNEGGNGEEAVEVIADASKMTWPVGNFEALQVETKFYDKNASEADKEAALIQVNNEISPHTGIDFVDPNGETFEVMAALEGVVSHVELHPTNGYIVEIDHGNGLVTVYQSLTDVQVEKGEEVGQGTVIAQAGRSDLEKDLGVHLHFETRLNGDTVNPSNYIAE